ncbi:unnamed protein product [Urochloa decumbens]|uniref:Transposase n=1 Tax=Urochloa decumbens TaxID=240449 RepID=A0ABC9GQX7_9POAL
MAFGSGTGGSRKRRRSEDDEDGEDIDTGAGEEEVIELEDEEEEQPCQAQAGGKINPFTTEITMLGGEKGKNDGGSKHWRCNHCKKAFKSSLTRVRVHLLGAQPGKKPQIQRCPVLLNDVAKTRELRDKVKEAEQSSKSWQQKGMVLNNPIAQSFGAAERDAADMKIIKFIAANGISFNVLRSPYYSEMVSAINNAPKGYKGPGSEKGRTTLLDALKRNVENDLSPVRDTWLTQGVSVVSDGWTNIKGQPLINVLASNSVGSCFLYAEDYSGIEKTGDAIAEFLLKAIEEIGPKNVIQVVTDNASNCKAAGREIQKVHKHIFWSPCVVHTLNLMFKDFAGKFTWMEDTYKAGKAIVNFFRSHCHCLAMFRNNSDLDLLKVAKTRFASHYILLERLRTVRDGITTTVVTRQWKEWVKSCSSDQQEQAKAIVDAINDEHFWNEVDNILAITKPLYLVLRFSDGEGPKMGEIYERMDNMVGEIKDIMTQDDNPHKLDYPEVEEIIMDRWEKMNIPLHSLAFALNPKYYDQRYIEKPAPGGFVRKAPNKDPDVMKGVLEAIKKIGDDASEQKFLREQFTHFISKKGIYALPYVKQDAYSMDAIDWWETYGSETPDLAAIAIKILSQPISSSSAERIWSTYEYIHSAKRNKLNAKNADKLVYIHSNLRLLSRVTESYKKGPHSKWDMDPSDSTI